MAWVMVASNNGGGGYAQSGFMGYPGVGIRHFAEDNQTGGAYRRAFVGGDQTPGSSHLYKENFGPGPYVQEMVDATNIQTTNFNPYAAWTQPFSPQFLGETFYPQTDIPGNASAHTNYTQMQWEHSNQSWDNNIAALGLGGGSGSVAAYKATALDTNCRCFDIWTQR